MARKRDWAFEKAIATNPRYGDRSTVLRETGYLMPLGPGDRTSAEQERRRNKGARKGKRYVASGHPAGQQMGAKRRRSKANERMKARRKARRAEKQREFALKENAAGLEGLIRNQTEFGGNGGQSFLQNCASI